MRINKQIKEYKYTMKRSVYTLFLLIFAFVLPFFGGIDAKTSFAQGGVETNAFRIIRQADSSGKIGLSYIFPVNTAILQQEGFNEGEIKTYRFYLSTYVNALAAQNRAKAVEGMSVGGVTYFEDVDGLGFSIIFDDINAQKRFFGSNEDNSDNQEASAGTTTKTSGFLVKKLQMSVAFPISKTGAEDLKTLCNMALQAWAKDENINGAKSANLSAALEKATYIYDYATQNTDLKSNVMYDDQNFHHNVFAKTAAQLEENPTITFYTTYVNTPVWYACAIVVTLAGMGVAYVVLKRKTKQKAQ